MNKLTIITDIPTPYRIFFFTQLYHELLKRNIDLEVIFFAESVPIRHWKIDVNELVFPCKIARGIHIYIGSNNFHFNPGILWNILVNPPRWLLVGGAWNIPTCFLSVFIMRLFHKHRCSTMLWSEANKYSMTHKSGVTAFFRRIVASSVNMFAVPGEMAIDTIINEWGVGNKIFLPLPNLINEDKFKNTSVLNKNEIILKENLNGILNSENDVILLWPARLDETKKGILNFLNPIKHILSDSRLKIIIAGDGPDKDRIKHWVTENMPKNVLLIGQRSETEMLELYSIADVLLLPSLSDPNPLSVIEGLWSSLPLLISKHCGNHIEAVKNNYNGWVIDPHSPDSIKSAIRDLNDLKKSEFKKYGDNSLLIAKEKFSSGISTKRFVDALLLKNQDY